MARSRPNYGRKTILGPTRHQQRKREKLEQSLERAQQRVDKQRGCALKAQQDKVLSPSPKDMVHASINASVPWW